MNTQTNTETPTASAIPISQKLKGLIIPAVIILPMLIATLMFYTGWGVSGLTTNKGELIHPPLPINTLTIENQPDYFSNLYDGSEKRWRLLVPVTANCDSTCQDNLYLTRQVHIRLAQKAYRVERILLLLENLDDTQLEAIKKDHPTTRIINTNTNEFNRWLSNTSLAGEAKNHYYLIDQEGNAMMRYNNEHTGQHLLDDLKKLLKYTYSK